MAVATLASDKQIAFIKSLADEKDTSTLAPAALDALTDALVGKPTDKRYASRLIELLLAAPRKPRPAGTVQAPAVADGRYAIDFEGQTRFFRVRTPSEGRWEGFTFVDEQASDDLYPVKNRDRRNAVLAAIQADPEALANYGRLLGYCGVCNRTLTDETSRALGIGPVCREK